MPTLKQLTCTIELTPTNHVLPSYSPLYNDNHLSTYIAIPSLPTSFSIHLTSSGYIAPGLAMFVYMDGQYQCNRNRRGLIVPGSGVRKEHYEIDFRVRQKEEKVRDGSWVGREWRFEGLNLAEADKIENANTNETVLANMGTIEVIVLRCKEAPQPPPDQPKPSKLVSSKPSSSSKTSDPNSAPTNTTSEKPSQKIASAEKPTIEEVPIKRLPARAIQSSSNSAKKPSPKPPKFSKSEDFCGMLGGIFDGPSSPPLSSTPKPYWHLWNKRSSSSTTSPYILPPNPRPEIPSSLAKDKGLSHQVATGPGASYLHLCSRPEYLDSMDAPYAVFTFKYRSKDAVEKVCGVKVEEEGKEGLERMGMKAMLKGMSREELEREVFAMKMENTSSSSSSKKQSSSTSKSTKTGEVTTIAQADTKHPWETTDNTNNAWGASNDTPAAVDTWNNTDNTNNDNNNNDNNPWAAPEDTKPASKASSKASAFASKKQKLPGSWPETSPPQAEADASNHSKSKFSTSSKKARSSSAKNAKEEKKDDSQEAKKKEGQADATAGAQGGQAWNTTTTAATAGDWENTAPVAATGAQAWDTTAPVADDGDKAKADQQWKRKVELFFIGAVVAMAIAVAICLILGSYTGLYTTFANFWDWISVVVSMFRNTFSFLWKAVSVAGHVIIETCDTLSSLGDLGSGSASWMTDWFVWSLTYCWEVFWGCFNSIWGRWRGMLDTGVDVAVVEQL